MWNVRFLSLKCTFFYEMYVFLWNVRFSMKCTFLYEMYVFLWNVRFSIECKCIIFEMYVLLWNLQSLKCTFSIKSTYFMKCTFYMHEMYHIWNVPFCIKSILFEMYVFYELYFLKNGFYLIPYQCNTLPMKYPTYLIPYLFYEKPY